MSVLLALIAGLVAGPALPVGAADPPVVFTVAGGAGGAAAPSVATRPCAIAARAGELYIADEFWHVVRRVNLASGAQEVIAGNGQHGYYGDDGPGREAALGSPCGLAVDGQGDVYIADSGNQRIRELTPDGLIHAFAGTGKDAFGGDGGDAGAADLGSPGGMCLDGHGGLVFADHNNSRVRRIDLATHRITTDAGSSGSGYSGDGGAATAAQLSYPQDVACAPDGTIYVADSANQVVRKVAVDGAISTIAGDGKPGYSGDGGPALQAEMRYMNGIAVGADGTVYVSDTSNQHVRAIGVDGIIRGFAGDTDPGVEQWDGDGHAPAATALDNPAGLAVDETGRLYVADRFHERVRSLGTSVVTVAGDGFMAYGGDGGPATAGQLHGPTDVAFGPDGSEYIADSFNDRVRRVSPGGVISTFAGDGTDASGGDGLPAVRAQVRFPDGLAIDAHGNVFIAEELGHRVREVTPDGMIRTYAGTGVPGFSGDGGPATAAQVEFPGPLAIGPDGNLYLADTYNNRVRVVEHATGVISEVAGGGPTLSSVNRNICNYDDGLPATHANLIGPAGLVFGPSGQLYISDYGNNRVRVVDPAGNIRTVAGTCFPGMTGDGGPATKATMQGPRGLAVDAAGALYIADSGNDDIRVVDPGGTINDYAGIEEPGFMRSWAKYSGDGGPAAAAELSFPNGMAFDMAGNLHFADQGNERVRAVGHPSLAAVPDLPWPAGALLLASGVLAACLVRRSRGGAGFWPRAR